MATNNVFPSPDQSSSNDVVSPTTAFGNVNMEERDEAEPRKDQDDHEDQFGSDDWLELDAHHAAAAEIVTYGAHLIDARRPFDAIEILRESVELLSRPSVFIRASDGAAPEEEYYATVDAAVSKAERRFVDDGVTSSESEHLSNILAETLLVGEGGTTNPLPLYSCPVFLQEPQSGSVVLDEVSAVALYNLALAHHMAGTSRAALASSDPSRTRALIDKALALYTMAESLLAQLRDAYPRLLRDEATSSQLLLSPGELMRLSMALANNVGAILLGDGRDHVRGRERFEGLRRFLIATHADEFDARVFELNVLGASQMNGAPAA